jgi:hypothetical protein
VQGVGKPTTLIHCFGCVGILREKNCVCDAVEDWLSENGEGASHRTHTHTHTHIATSRRDHQQFSVGAGANNMTEISLWQKPFGIFEFSKWEKKTTHKVACESEVSGAVEDCVMVGWHGLDFFHLPEDRVSDNVGGSFFSSEEPVE